MSNQGLFLVDPSNAGLYTEQNIANHLNQVEVTLVLLPEHDRRVALTVLASVAVGFGLLPNPRFKEYLCPQE